MSATVLLVGNVGNDPEIKFTKDGAKIATVRLAVEVFSAGEKKTEWFRINAWRKHADLLEKFVRKGNKLGIVGDLATSEYTSREGVKRTTLEVTTLKIDLLTPKGGKSDEGDDSEDAWM